MEKQVQQHFIESKAAANKIVSEVTGDVEKHLQQHFRETRAAASKMISKVEDVEKEIQQHFRVTKAAASKMISEVEDVEKEVQQQTKEAAKEIVSQVGDVENHIHQHYLETKMSANTLLSEVGDVTEDVFENMGEAVEEIYEETDNALENGALSPSSLELLIRAEKTALKESVKVGVITNVEVGPDNEIHTICFQSESRKGTQVPLVMLHGLGGGLPAYHKNFCELHHDRDVYGIDLPGFALSSRVKILGDAKECTDKYVDMIEKWRLKMRIDKFIILGHSFGGYISAAYAVKYPSHVAHLVLVDPWGILPKEEDKCSHDSELWERCAREISYLLKSAPFDLLRSTGPFAPLVTDIFIPDYIKNAYGENLVNYFFHAIAQDAATGEMAFSIISGYEYLWAKHPIRSDLINMDASVPITFIYGEKSPFYNNLGHQVKKERKNVFLPEPLPDVGHHVHAECPDMFNKLVKDIYSITDLRISGSCV